ncbi:tape measure domain-containing protein [Pseudochelatococcus lubricantis]|uniref:Tape measure domain-containing protein n=1 Tax=Pseudochelatococcus lubricantis TaxID=1538102 RepID=A0ABX0UWB8_9HYPH|nr:tape measure protein [Pseudochelatococcus lubricantis]NIJ57251.1 tape measure domain-containing protein [Pseudochelatococcus lubricantis]
MATTHSVNLEVNTAGVKKASVDLADIEKSINEAGKAIDTFGDKSNDAGKSVEKTGEKTRKVITNFERVEKAIRDAEKAMQQMARATSHMGSSIDRMEAELRQATAAMRASAEATRAMQASIAQMGSSFDRAVAGMRSAGSEARAGASSVSLLSTAYSHLAGLIAGLGVYQLGRTFIEMADTSKMLEGRLKLVTSSSDELVAVQGRLYAVAQGSGSALESTVELYARLARSTRSLGVESDTLLTVTNTLQQAFAVSGASTQEATNAIIQMSQGLAAGALRGEEFNSVAEQGSRITELLADSLGMTIGELRAFAAEGGITTQVIIDATVKGAQKIAEEYAKLPPTVEREMTLMRNAVLQGIGDIDKELAITETIARHMKEMRQAIEAADIGAIIDKWVPSFGAVAAAVTLVSGAMASRLVPSLALTAGQMAAPIALAWQISASATAAAAATSILSGALSALNAVMRAFGGPIGLVISGVAAGIAYWATSTDDATASLRVYESVLNSIIKKYRESAGDVEKFAKALDEMSRTELEASLQKARKEFESIKQTMGEIAGGGLLTTFKQAFGVEMSEGARRLADATDRLFKSGDLTGFRQTLDAISAATPEVAQQADELMKLASKYEDAGRNAGIFSNAVAASEGDMNGAGRTADLLAGKVTGMGNAAAGATPQVYGLSSAMKEIIALAPQMNAAMQAQMKLATLQSNYQKEMAAAEEAFQQSNDAAAYVVQLEKLNAAMGEATGNVTGYTAAQETVIAQSEKIARDALPREERARAELNARYDEAAEKIRKTLETGAEYNKVQELIAQNEKNRSGDMANLNRDLEAQAAKHSKAGKAARDHAKATQQLENAVEQLIHRNDEQIKLLELEAAGYGKSAEEVLYLKYAHDAETAALRAKVPLTEQHLARLREQAQQVSALTAALDAQRKAQEALNQVQDLVSATWVRALEDMTLNAETLTDAIKGIGDAWSKASLDALLTGKGPLAQFTGLASNDPSNPNAVGGIFGVLMGNTNKLISSIPKQVEKGAEKGTASGAETGIATSFSSGGSAGTFLEQNGKAIMGAMAGVTSLVGAYGVGMSGGSMGMAGVGGAISGATGGMALGGISLAGGGTLGAALGLSSAALGGIGAVIGAGISVYANQEAKKQAKQARYEEAQANYQSALPAMKELSAALAGDVTGTLQQAVDQARSKTHELLVIATNAFRMDEVDRLYKEFDAFEARIGKEFRDVFEGTLDQLSAGGALSGAFTSAKSEMQSFGDELLTWVEDVKKAFNVWSGGEAEQATQAARDAALAMLEPAESISAVQQAIQQVNGRASALQGILEDLYMSSGDAARAIDEGVLRAMDALRTSFSDDLTSKLYDAQDKGYMNDVRDTLAEVEQMYSDAAALGIDESSRIAEYLKLSAQGIVDGAELTGGAFDEMLMKFPELSGVVHQFVATMDEAIQTAGQFNESMIDKVLGAQGKSYIVDMRNLLTERDSLTQTAQQLGADVGLVNQYFGLAAQNIVTNAQLTGDAFNDLLAWFPQLSGQLTAFSAAAQQVGDTFWDVQNNVIDKILGAQGKSYISDMRALITERDELTATAQSVGVDVGLVNQYFSLAAQNIVDNAGLTGDAFADLISWFPDLSSSLKEAGKAVEQTADQIAAAAERIRGFEDRFFAATNDNGTLDGALREFDRTAARGRAAELAAGGQGLVALERAIAAERLNVQAQFAADAVSAAQSAVDTARQNLQSAAQAAIDAAQAQVDAAQTAAQAAAQAVSDAQSRVDAAQQALERAQDAVRQGYEDQASTLRDTVSRLQSFIKGIKEFKASLVLDDSLSPYSPAQRLAEAQRQYQEIAAKALAGDTGAMDQLESVSRSYLEEARGYYASSEAYYQAFNDVQSVLDRVSASAQDQLSEAERQLAALDAQIAALTRIDDTVLSIEQAQADLLAAQQELVTAQQQQSQADSALSVAQANLDAVQSQMDALLGIDKSVMSVYQAIQELTAAESALAKAQQTQADILAQQQALAAKNPNELFVQQAYRDVFGREADTGGLSYWTNQMDVGASTAAQVMERLNWEKAHGAMRFGGIVGSYATGGMVGNGMWDVDSVLARYAGGGNIALAGGEFVTRAPSVNRDTLPTLAAINATGRLPSANDDSAKAEIRALRQEVAELKQALVAGFNGTIGAVSQTTSAVKSTESTIGRQRIAR